MENILHLKENNPHSRSNSSLASIQPPHQSAPSNPESCLFVIPNSREGSLLTTQSSISPIGPIRRMSPIPPSPNSLLNVSADCFFCRYFMRRNAEKCMRLATFIIKNDGICRSVKWGRVKYYKYTASQF